ncbi:MAG: hypothetical protein M2R45_03079 [Verrucomicrobia subdivision 3 bacterium]|nr:hypothetical protein [Limisphaerales bacterium]MCS1416565.1 hypothetical protein [Limisphaerales bacterium]
MAAPTSSPLCLPPAKKAPSGVSAALGRLAGWAARLPDGGALNVRPRDEPCSSSGRAGGLKLMAAPFSRSPQNLGRHMAVNSIGEISGRAPTLLITEGRCRAFGLLSDVSGGNVGFPVLGSEVGEGTVLDVLPNLAH